MYTEINSNIDIPVLEQTLYIENSGKLFMDMVKDYHENEVYIAENGIEEFYDELVDYYLDNRLTIKKDGTTESVILGIDNTYLKSILNSSLKIINNYFNKTVLLSNNNGEEIKERIENTYILYFSKNNYFNVRDIKSNEIKLRIHLDGVVRGNIVYSVV